MRNPLIVTIFLCFLSANVYATGQIPELIVVGNDTLWMHSTPLGALDSIRYADFSRRVKVSNNGGECTALWRGYLGIWKLQDDTLRLLKVVGSKVLDNKDHSISAWVKGDTISMEGILPPNGYADWFSGDIHVVWGKCIDLDLFTFKGRFEHEVVYTLRNGVVASHEKLDNRVIGNKSSFEAAVRKIAQDPPIVQAADTNKYQRIEVVFNAIPDDDGHIRQFNYAGLYFRDFKGHRTIVENDPDHPYLLELLRRLSELEPYVVWVEGEKIPIRIIDFIPLYQAKSTSK